MIFYDFFLDAFQRTKRSFTLKKKKTIKVILSCNYHTGPSGPFHKSKILCGLSDLVFPLSWNLLIVHHPENYFIFTCQLFPTILKNKKSENGSIMELTGRMMHYCTILQFSYCITQSINSSFKKKSGDTILVFFLALFFLFKLNF